MTTINQNKEDIYSYEDRKLLISLLNEYSQKLSNICVQIEKYKGNSRTISLVQIAIMIAIVAVWIIVTINGIIGREKYVLDELANRILFSLGMLLAILFLVNESLHNKKKLRSLERNGIMIAVKLEKVIKIASQIQEHVLKNLISRIELDLRLADAESALENYYQR
jgi:hypothetical protein